MTGSRRHARSRALVGGAIAWFALTTVLVRTVADTVAALRTGLPSLDELTAGIAAGAGLVVLVWAALAVGCTALAAGLESASPLGHAAHRLAARLVPAVARPTISLCVGAVLASAAATPAVAATPAAPAGIATAGIATAGSATAASGRIADLWSAPGGSRPDPGWVPTLSPADTNATLPTSTNTTPPTSTNTTPPSGTNATVPADAGLDRADASGPLWGATGRLRAGATAETEVVVRRGETLWEVAARYLGPYATDAEIAEAWPRWYAANREQIGADPDVLYPGQRLRPPSSPLGGSR